MLIQRHPYFVCDGEKRRGEDSDWAISTQYMTQSAIKESGDTPVDSHCNDGNAEVPILSQWAVPMFGTAAYTIR